MEAHPAVAVPTYEQRASQAVVSDLTGLVSLVLDAVNQQALPETVRQALQLLLQ